MNKIFMMNKIMYDKHKGQPALHFKDGTIFFRKNKDGTSDIWTELEYLKEYINQIFEKFEENKEYNYQDLINKKII